MSEIKFVELKCCRCGGQLTGSGTLYMCTSCGKTFEKQTVTDFADQLRKVLNEQKQEAVANLRRQLWAEMHEQYINSEKIISLARDIKKYLPEDYFANFCEVANDGSDKQISVFLNNTPQSVMSDYADAILDFMIKSVKPANLAAISLFIERAFKGDIKNYDKYINLYENEAQKVTQGLYELNITRDVFLAYSSKDIDKVLELCDFLERNKITCFLALRNLRHGRGAVDNYDQALKTAIDNCKTVVFVSSTSSRDLGCDALTKELPYIKKKDIENAPAEFKRNYYKIPPQYLMPRVQYLVEDFKSDGNVAESIVDEFFHDLEWCRSKEEVARRVTDYITAAPDTPVQKNADIDYNVLAARFAEEQRKIAEEQERKNKEEERQRRFLKESVIKDGIYKKYNGKDSEIVIPDIVEAIDDNAFRDCKWIKSVSIPNSVLVIGRCAFYECSSLKSITIGNGVEAIDGYAFYGCKSLTNITIPKSVTSIEERVFTGCESLEHINVISDNKNYKSIDGVLYSKDGKTLILYPAGKKGNDFTVPNEVTTIADFAFALGKLIRINLGNSVTSIGENAFESCFSLSNITIPNTVTSIGRYAFAFCAFNSIIIPNVTCMGSHAFRGCANLKTIYCRTKKSLFGLPKGWDKLWLGSMDSKCNAQVIWNYKD